MGLPIFIAVVSIGIIVIVFFMVNRAEKHTHNTDNSQE